MEVSDARGTMFLIELLGTANQPPDVAPESRTATDCDGVDYDARLVEPLANGGAIVAVWVEGYWSEFEFDAAGRYGDFTVELPCIRGECAHAECRT